MFAVVVQFIEENLGMIAVGVTISTNPSLNAANMTLSFPFKKRAEVFNWLITTNSIA